MFRMPDDGEIHGLLQQGLRQVPVPRTSADFDARVRSGIRRKESGWQMFWSMSRTLLVPAACSLVLTLLFLNGTGAPRPGTTAITGALPTGNVALDRARSVEQALERIDRYTPSLGGFSSPRQPDRAEPEPQSRPRSRKGASATQRIPEYQVSAIG